MKKIIIMLIPIFLLSSCFNVIENKENKEVVNIIADNNIKKNKENSLERSLTKKEIKNDEILIDSLKEGDIKKCNELNNEELIFNCQISIINEKATKEYDSKICDTIKEQKFNKNNIDDYVNRCKKQIIFENAGKKRDKKYCEDFPDGEDKNNCISLVESLIKYDKNK